MDISIGGNKRGLDVVSEKKTDKRLIKQFTKLGLFTLSLCVNLACVRHSKGCEKDVGQAYVCLYQSQKRPETTPERKSSASFDGERADCTIPYTN